MLAKLMALIGLGNINIASASKFLDLDGVDWLKIWTGAKVAFIGAFIVFFSDTVGHVDFGVWTPFIAAGASSLVNTLRKLLADNSSLN